MRKARKTLRDDRGFTLVELLAAIGILLLVVVPLLHAFVTSAGTNKKARVRLEATTAAENVMEKIKSMDLSELLEKSTYQQEQKKYLWESMETVNGEEYEVMAHLDPGTYQAGAQTPAATDYNSLGLADIADMDQESNAFYVESTDLDQKVAEGTCDATGWNIKVSAVAGSAEKDTIFDNMKRLIDVLVTKEHGITKVYVTINYTYTYAYYVNQETSGDTEEETLSKTPVQNVCCYTAPDTAKELQNVYLFYEPLYTGSRSEIHETIYVRNETVDPVRVYLAKQKNDRTNESSETRYGTTVNIMDTKMALTTVRTNLKEEQMDLYYGTDKAPLAHSQMVNGQSRTAQELVDLGTIAEKKNKDVLYTVEITVRKKGDTDELVSLTGTKEK